MFLAAKRKNIWQLRRQNFHTRKNDSASYAGYKHGSNLLYYFVLFCFLIKYVSTTNAYMYYLLLVLLKIRDIFLT